ncbi:MAG: hypothetical protein QF649_06925, partial [SAR324 cluster bacterium]|nr:hypothetical protein [SAR324 cluster bacterium]
MKEQTGNKMVLEEQKETIETSGSSLRKQQDELQVLNTTKADTTNVAPEIDSSDNIETESDEQLLEAELTSINISEIGEHAEDNEKQIPE